MQVRMTTDHRIALDGIHIAVLAEGSEHDLDAETAERLIAEGKAEPAKQAKDAGAAPENKDAGTSAERKTPAKRRGAARG